MPPRARLQDAIRQRRRRQPAHPHRRTAALRLRLHRQPRRLRELPRHPRPALNPSRRRRPGLQDPGERPLDRQRPHRDRYDRGRYGGAVL
jgi:hypothetical protein